VLKNLKIGQTVDRVSLKKRNFEARSGYRRQTKTLFWRRRICTRKSSSRVSTMATNKRRVAYFYDGGARSRPHLVSLAQSGIGCDRACVASQILGRFSIPALPAWLPNAGGQHLREGMAPKMATQESADEAARAANMICGRQTAKPLPARWACGILSVSERLPAGLDVRANADPAGAPVRFLGRGSCWGVGVLPVLGPCASSSWLLSLEQGLALFSGWPNKAVIVQDGGRVRRLLMVCVCAVCSRDRKLLLRARASHEAPS
jgi:hypothetical protein